MTASDLTQLHVHELGQRVQDGEVSPVEIAQACLDRIAQHNAPLNAFVTVDAEGALAAAKVAEKEIAAGNYRGPLHGIPVGHKDLYATRGMRTTGGSRVLEHHVPDSDATVVAKLADAGMVNLGKTNTHEFAYGPTNEVSMFGRVANPWDTARISGGSSGGSGAAVAAGLVPIASGSDTGGSIRMPAACCGLTGLKPTYGRVSRAGILPLCWTMDHAGPLARCAEDAALFLQATAGPDPLDEATAQVAVPDYLAQLNGDIRGLKIGVPRAMFFDRAQSVVVERVDAAIAALAEQGAEIREIEIAHAEHAVAAALAIYLAEATAYHDDTLDDHADHYDEQVRTFLELGDQLLAKDYLHAQRFRTLFGKELARAFRDVDVLAIPGTPITATPAGATEIDINGTPDSVFAALLRNTEPFNLSGLPACVAPCGFDADGMPVSIQIVGPSFTEGRVLNVVHSFQQVSDWHRQYPGAA